MTCETWGVGHPQRTAGYGIGEAPRHWYQTVRRDIAEMGLEATGQIDPERARRMNLAMRSAELFQVLVLKTDGEPAFVQVQEKVI